MKKFLKWTIIGIVGLIGLVVFSDLDIDTRRWAILGGAMGLGGHFLFDRLDRVLAQLTALRGAMDSQLYDIKQRTEHLERLIAEREKKHG